MNEHLLYLLAAYGLTAVCMLWELVALRLRRQSARRLLCEAIVENGKGNE